MHRITKHFQKNPTRKSIDKQQPNYPSVDYNLISTDWPTTSHVYTPITESKVVFNSLDSKVAYKKKDAQKIFNRHHKHPLVFFVPSISISIEKLEELIIFTQPDFPGTYSFGIYMLPELLENCDSFNFAIQNAISSTLNNIITNSTTSAIDQDVSISEEDSNYLLLDSQTEDQLSTPEPSHPPIKLDEVALVRQRPPYLRSSRKFKRSRFLSNPIMRKVVIAKSPNSRPLSAEASDGVTSGSATIAASRRSSRPSVTLTNIDPNLIRQARLRAAEAIKHNKVFAVLGPYRHIREGLRRRGWIEKFYLASININGKEMSKADMRIFDQQLDAQQYIDDTENNDDFQNEANIDDTDFSWGFSFGCSSQNIMSACLRPSVSPETKRGGAKQYPWNEEGGLYGLLSRSLRNVTPNFIWSLKKAQIDFKNLRKDQIVNHHSKAPFTTKIGLCRELRDVHWHDSRGLEYFFPRCYILSANEEKKLFINEFRLTAAMSLIKWSCNYYKDDKTSTTSSSIENKANVLSKENDQAMPESINKLKTFEKNVMAFDYALLSKAITMAIIYCEEYLRSVKNEDLDENNAVFFTLSQWDHFLQSFYSTFTTESPYKKEEAAYIKCQEMCNKLSALCPQFDVDGKRNVWIVKPGAKSRGRGIACHNKLDNILALISDSFSGMDNRYVVQKYLETPLLIFNTKFDIRQWFLVTDWQPLTVWWYQDCYLRFCSREFTLENFSEAAHLSNNSISHKYANGKRSTFLPKENMWYLEDFKKYLRGVGQGKVWENKILPEMRKAIINSLLCSQESIDVRKNCFELYGADFMVTRENFRPWLIEINASPCMAPSTSVTMDLAAKVLEDTLKVVIDRKNDRNCDVGKFELIFRQPVPPRVNYNGTDLRVLGTRLSNNGYNPQITTNKTPMIMAGQTPDPIKCSFNGQGDQGLLTNKTMEFANLDKECTEFSNDLNNICRSALKSRSPYSQMFKAVGPVQIQQLINNSQENILKNDDLKQFNNGKTLKLGRREYSESPLRTPNARNRMLIHSSESTNFERRPRSLVITPVSACRKRVKSDANNFNKLLSRNENAFEKDNLAKQSPSTVPTGNLKKNNASTSQQKRANTALLNSKPSSPLVYQKYSSLTRTPPKGPNIMQSFINFHRYNEHSEIFRSLEKAGCRSSRRRINGSRERPKPLAMTTRSSSNVDSKQNSSS